MVQADLSLSLPLCLYLVCEWFIILVYCGDCPVARVLGTHKQHELIHFFGMGCIELEFGAVALFLNTITVKIYKHL